jgi:hypothetical protein
MLCEQNPAKTHLRWFHFGLIFANRNQGRCRLTLRDRVEIPLIKIAVDGDSTLVPTYGLWISTTGWQGMLRATLGFLAYANLTEIAGRAQAPPPYWNPRIRLIVACAAIRPISELW